MSGYIPGAFSGSYGQYIENNNSTGGIAINLASFFTSSTVIQSVQSDIGVTSVGGKVSDWADQSGNNRHYSQPVGASQPLVSTGINGIPGVLFDGVDDFMRAINMQLPIPSTTNLYIFAVYRVISPAALGNSAIFSSSLYGQSIFAPSTLKNSSQYNGTIANANTATAASNFGVFTSLFSGSTSDFTKFNANFVTGTSSGNTATNVDGFRYVGGGVSINFSNIEVMAVIHLNAAPTADQVAAATNAAAQKYGWQFATPQSIFGPSSVLQWNRADLGVTIGTGVSAWADQSGNGWHYTQATGANQPAYSTSDATLSGRPSLTFAAGVSNMVSSLILPAPSVTPACILSVFKAPTNPGSNRQLYVAAGSSIQYVRLTSTPGVESLNGLSTIGVPMPLNTWSRHRADFSNSNRDVTQYGATSTTGNSGNGSIAAGRTIGGAVPPNVVLWELLYLNKIPSSTEIAQYDAYVNAITGGGIAI